LVRFRRVGVEPMSDLQKEQRDETVLTGTGEKNNPATPESPTTDGCEMLQGGETNDHKKIQEKKRENKGIKAEVV